MNCEHLRARFLSLINIDNNVSIRMHSIWQNVDLESLNLRSLSTASVSHYTTYILYFIGALFAFFFMMLFHFIFDFLGIVFRVSVSFFSPYPVSFSLITLGVFAWLAYYYSCCVVVCLFDYNCGLFTAIFVLYLMNICFAGK